MADEGSATPKVETPTTEQPTAGGAKTTVTTTSINVSDIPDEALKDRLDRVKKQTLKETGFASAEEAKAAREKLSKYEADEVERQKAAMTEQERVSAELATERAQREAAQAELAAERETNALLQVAHSKGVKNVDYARFLVDKAKKTANGEAVDIEKIVGEAMGDPSARAALGIVEETPAGTPQKQLANTSPGAGGGTPPKPPTAGGGQSGPKSSKDMTPTEWAAYKRSIGII